MLFSFYRYLYQFAKNLQNYKYRSKTLFLSLMIYDVMLKLRISSACNCKKAGPGACSVISIIFRNALCPFSVACVVVSSLEAVPNRARTTDRQA